MECPIIHSVKILHAGNANFGFVVGALIVAYLKKTSMIF